MPSLSPLRMRTAEDPIQPTGNGANAHEWTKLGMHQQPHLSHRQIAVAAIDAAKTSRILG